MWKSLIAATMLTQVAFSLPAWAITGTTTIRITDGATAIPQASVTITFKDQQGTPIETVKRTMLRSGARKVQIPDNAQTADISVTTPKGKREKRTGIDVKRLTDKNYAIDVPGSGRRQIGHSKFKTSQVHRRSETSRLHKELRLSRRAVDRRRHRNR